MKKKRKHKTQPKANQPQQTYINRFVCTPDEIALGRPINDKTQKTKG